MKATTILLLSALSLLSACASTEISALPVNDLFHDTLFAPASTPIRASDAMAVSEPMKEYARKHLWHQSGHVNTKDQRNALVEAMYTKGELHLDYDATTTRTASEAFDAKSGNCLSLVLLTSAMAKQINLPVRYQSVIGVSDWNQLDQLFVSIGHVNLVLDPPRAEFALSSYGAEPLVVDFLPPDQAKVLKSALIDESTVVAMYLNNRAVESLIAGNVNDAYWYARESLLQDPTFFNAYITLGVIYRKISHPEFADNVFVRVAQRDPDNITLLTNRILVLKDLGREQEAQRLTARLANLDPHPAMSYYRIAQQEMAAGHYESAKHLIEKEIARDPYHPEFEVGLALVYYKLNNADQARQHLNRAIELSTSKQARDLYHAKLEWLKTQHTVH